MEVYGAYRANVALVRDALRESNSQMARVDQSLGMFQTRLLGVEREMLPIYTLTEKLRATQKHIDLCVHELRRINDNFVAAQQLAPTLMNGSKFEQDAYVQALQKLLAAIAFLESHRTYDGSSKALEHAKELLAQAKRKCKSDFVSAVGVLVRGVRRDVDASDSVGGSADASPYAAALEWSAPNKREVAKVAQLLHCLLSANMDQTELLTEYGKQRFEVVRMALTDDDSASSSTTATPSIGFDAAAASICDLTRKLVDVEASLAAEKRLTESIFPTEELAHAAFRYAAFPVLDALRSDVDAALQQLTVSSSSASGSTFAHLSLAGAALPSTNTSSMAPAVGATGGESSSIRSSKPQSLDPFKLLLLHELLVTRARDFEPLIAPPLLLHDRKGYGRDDPWALPKLLASVVTQLATAAKQRLFGFQIELTDRINASDRALAKDGNVHPVSSHMLSFLRQVCEHTQPLRVLLARQESNMTPTSFVETAVMQLAEALQSKSAQVKTMRADLKQLFLANNFGYVARALPHCSTAAERSRSSGGANTKTNVNTVADDDDDDIATHIERELRPRFERLRDAAIAQFVAASYASFQTFLIAPTEKLVFAKGGDLLTLESGRLLKEKFARFNAQLDDLSKTQTLFVVAEPHVRHKLIQAAVDAIVPAYTTFYDKYSVVHFSKKNSSKYLKYTPRAAEQALKELFMGEVVAASERK